MRRVKKSGHGTPWLLFPREAVTPIRSTSASLRKNWGGARSRKRFCLSCPTACRRLMGPASRRKMRWTPQWWMPGGRGLSLSPLCLAPRIFWTPPVRRTWRCTSKMSLLASLRKSRRSWFGYSAFWLQGKTDRPPSRGPSGPLK